MKSGTRIALCVVSLLCFALYLLEAHIQDICNQYRAGAYLVEWWYQKSGSNLPAHHGTPDDKVIVMAKLEEENTDWVGEELPDWQSAIYIVNPSEETRMNENILTTPYNKGHEAMAYLTYVIDHYYVLPSTIAFLHAHRSGFFMAWHVDAPLHDNVIAMQNLQTRFVEQNGYANLRCNWNPGCKADHRYNTHVTDEIWWDIFQGTSTPPLNVSSSYEVSRVDQKYIRKPEQIAAACCAQFAVSKDQVRRRPHEDYVRFRQWLLDTDLTDAKSGRVMEFLWHYIFGMDSVYCPDEELCYCQVYGQC
ncbi:uncharacterized protein N7484_003119 [Penicillium longicatenatum]|uniref:uncharacterized protein n=1 Tax=Penicillium longicatenatum TaxID=1561947 RepID=UPI0025467EEE|nr:uncharacterized protein N7484_003119 [Penicillium longicatenatum]KAJ5649396.1 hypothetical protein N7484_003119 [Penicillium longicatenatum]